jgi:phosphoglycerate dehydrogenase-like enzyme
MSSRYAVVFAEGVRQLVGPPPAGVEVLAWDGSGEPPAGVDAAGFWVPPYLVESFEDFLTAMPALEVVQLITAGADAFVGKLPPGVLLCDARGVHGGPTAEWVLAAVLAAMRHLPRFVLAQAERRWDPQRFTDELAGKRVLVVGAGDVGDHVRRRLLPFDVEVTMAARRARPAGPDTPAVAAVDELPDLLPRADVVVLVVPLTPQTRGMVDAAFLARMPDGALLVNASRGPVADTDALTTELLSGRLRAALDVTEPEPLPADHPLWTAPGLLLTPHIGGAVPGLAARAAELIRAQLARWAAGQPVENVVVDGY